MKRRWFQIHLSTALVIMLVAGVFVGLNTIPHHMETFISNEQGEYHAYYYGWPCDLCYAVMDRARSFLYHTADGAWSADIADFSLFYPAMNLAVCIGACAWIGAFMERRMRRKRNDA